MNPLKTFLLGLILLLALLYIYKVEMPAKDKESKKDFVFQPLTKEDLESIEIKKKDSSYALRSLKPSSKENELKWELADIPGGKVDTGSLNSLLSALIDLKGENKISDEDLSSDLSVYGLKESELSMVVRAKTSPKETELFFGKKNEYLGNRYLRVAREGGSKVYLVTETLYQAAQKNKNDFRDKTPFDFIPTQVTKLKLFVSGREAIEIMQDKAEWLVNGEVGDKIFVDQLIREIQNLKVSSWPQETRDFGFSNPKLKLEIYLKAPTPDSEEDKSIVLLVGEASELDGNNLPKSYYFTVGGPDDAMILSKELFDKISPRIESLKKVETPVPASGTPEAHVLEASPQVSK